MNETASVREQEGTVAPPPPGLVDRRAADRRAVDRKMMINALNSGARVFMADFEDSCSPTWANVVDGQVNLIDAVRRTISLDTPEKSYRLADEIATLVVRPRGWHLDERHVVIDGQPVSASLFDFGSCSVSTTRASNAARAALGPYFYLPKLESHLEARLWNDAFVLAEQEVLHLPRCLDPCDGADRDHPRRIRDERDPVGVARPLGRAQRRSLGLHLQRDQEARGAVLPYRAQVTMAVPFMRAYTELLVSTCHRRGAHAIGGMAAFIPSRRDPEVNVLALAKVRDDKVRESSDGFDGTWVAHPDLVPVAMEIFDGVLGEWPNQVDRLRDYVHVTAEQLLDFEIPGREVTDEGLRTNVSVGVRYLEAWPNGVGAAAIDNLMEDVATAEISRAQVWSWVRRAASTHGGSAKSSGESRPRARRKRCSRRSRLPMSSSSS